MNKMSTHKKWPMYRLITLSVFSLFLVAEVIGWSNGLATIMEAFPHFLPVETIEETVEYKEVQPNEKVELNESFDDELVEESDQDSTVMMHIPAGSFIINMGVQPQTVNNALKPYGLVWQLLHAHEVPVLWSINPDKGKDGIDFTHNGVAYRGGPFIVLAHHRTAAVNALIANWQAQGVVGVTTTSDFTAPVNRVLSYSMNWTLNSDNGSIAKAYLDRAGIPATAYNWTLPQNLNCCNDVFLMPHSEPTWASHNRLFTWNASPGTGGCGGALWAGCKAGSEVENIVNPANSSQRMNFLMQPPASPSGNPAVPSKNHSDGTLPYSYGFPAHPVMQFLGTMDGAQENGAEQIYLPTVGWRPTTKVGIWDHKHPQIPSLSPGLAAKLAFGPAFGDEARGPVMYQTAHRLDKDSKAANIAAQRAFFNFSFVAAGQKAIRVTSNIPDVIVGGTTQSLTATASGGSGNYYYHWTSTCPGTFSNPYSSTTSFTANTVLSDTECYIKVTVTDDCGTRVGFANVRILFQARPAPPVAVDDYEETQPGTPVTVNALANDSDPNGDPLTLTTLIGNTNTGNGLFVNSGNGQVTYTPNFDFVGIDQIQYVVCDNTPLADGGPLCDTATIHITVDWIDENGCYPDQYWHLKANGYATAVTAQNSIGNANQALGEPLLVASNSSYYALIDANNDYLVLDLGYTLQPGDTVFVYFGSGDNNPATLEVSGTLTSTNYNNGNGFFDFQSYTTTKRLNNSNPDQDVVAWVPATGPVRYLRFKRTNNGGRPGVNGLVYKAWECANARPVAQPDNATTCEDTPVDIDVLANDSDPQNLPLEVTLLTPPLHGTIGLLSDGTFRYQPNVDYKGGDSFTYKVCNSEKPCSEATVTITVNADNCPAGQYSAGLVAGNAVSVFSSTNTTTASNATGAVNGTLASIGASSGAMVLDFGTTVPQGVTVSLYMRYYLSSGSAIPHAVVTGSANGGGPFSGSVTYNNLTNSIAVFNYTVSQAGGIRYLRIGATAVSGTASNQFVRVDAAVFAYGNNCTGNCQPIPTFPPTAVNDHAVTNINKPVVIPVQSNDTDPSGLGLTTSLGSAATQQNGTVTVVDGLVLYTPPQGFYGQDQFTYTICNIYGCDNAVVTVDVLCADPGNGKAIQGRVFLDKNLSGTSNNGEPGLGGVKINLIDDSNGNGQYDPGEIRLDSVISDAQGNYVFHLNDAEISNSSSAIHFASGASGSINNDFPITNALGQPDGKYVKLGKDKHIVLEFPTTIPFGSQISLFLASDKKSGEAVISGSMTGSSFNNPMTWKPPYNNDPGSPPPTSAIVPVTYQVATQGGVKYIRVERTSNNIFLDAAYWVETVMTGSSSTIKFSRIISAGSDDAEEEGPSGANLGPGGMHLNSTDLEIVQDLQAPSTGTQKIGLRFNSMDIPPGAFITKAVLKLRAKTPDAPNTNNGPAAWVIRGQAADHATTFTTQVNNISNRPLTATSVEWDPTIWSANTTYESPDLKNLLQEIVNRPGWVSGNSLALIITGTGSRSAVSFNGSPEQAPILEISYSLQSPTLSFSPIADNTLYQKDGKNYGAANVVWVGSYNNERDRAVMKFDLSSIPANAVVTSATLQLVRTGGDSPAANISAHQITNSWTEGTGGYSGGTGVSNWNQRNAGVNWNTAGGDFNPSGEAVTSVSGSGIYTWSIPTMVQNWVSNSGTNHGVLLKMVTEPLSVEKLFGSREHSSANNRPKLTIEYVVPGGIGVSSNHYVVQVDTTTLPVNSFLTTAQTAPAFVENNGEVDCGNDFGIINHLPPVANPDTAFVKQGTTVTIDAIANDYDPEGTPLTMTILSNPANGTVVNLGNGTLTYKPNPGFLGWETFPYSVCDQGTPVLCDSSTISVLVEPYINTKPRAKDDYDTTVVNTHVEVDVLYNDFDAEFDELTAHLTPGILQPAHGEVEVVNDKLVEYKPEPGFTGDDVFEYIVCDNGTPSYCDTAKVYIHVRNQSPVARPDAEKSCMDSPLDVFVLRNDDDPDGHNVILVSAGNDAGNPTNGQTEWGGTVTLQDNGTPGDPTDDFILYTPAPGFWGTDKFYYRIRDTGTPHGYSISHVNVTVTGVSNLSISKTVAPLVTQIGQNVTFTLTLHNSGPAPASNVLVRDKLSGSYQFVGDSGSGTYDPITGIWWVALLNPGQTTTLQITATVLNNTNLKNEANIVTLDQCDPDSGDNADVIELELREICDNGLDDDGDGLTDCDDPDCNQNLVITISDDQEICAGSSAQLTVAASGETAPYTFTWSHGLGTGTQRTVSPSETTTYSVTVTPTAGCPGTREVTVTVNPAPVADAGSDITVCSGSPVVLTGSASSGLAPYTYTWNEGLGNGAVQTVSPDETTTYIVTVTDGKGCTATNQVTIGTVDAPTVNAGNDVVLCIDGSTVLSASATGGVAPYIYNWSNGLGTGPNKTVSPEETTTYSVTVTGNNGCVSHDFVTVIVQPCPEICGNGLDDDLDGLTDCEDSECGFDLEAGLGLSICIGSQAELTASPSTTGDYSFAWSHGLGTGPNKSVSPSVTTTYSVTATNDKGCTATASVTVLIAPCPEICGNGLDDDGDGLVDCDDPDCYSVGAPVLANDHYTTCPGMPFTERVTYNDANLQSPVFSIAVQPQHGTVSIDWTGKFYYLPLDLACNTDQFVYRVCNQTSGCCAEATVTITMGDNTHPVLTNIPADITISCDDVIPSFPTVTAFDNCPGVTMEFSENSTQHFAGACGTYSITRTWKATDFCGNSATGKQTVTVVDQTRPEIFRVYTLDNGSKLVAGVAQRVTENWKYVQFPATFSEVPVVFAQVVTNRDVAAVTVRQRNITRQGFEIRLVEEEAADGKHQWENVAWIAIEPGSQQGALDLQAGTFSNVNDQIRTLPFATPFPTVPHFFASLQSAREMDAVTVRLNSLTQESAQFFLQEETSADGETGHLSETLGYIAIAQGGKLADKQGKRFGEMGTINLTNVWTPITLQGSYTKPVVIVGTPTFNDSDPLTVRVRNVTKTGFELRLQEWDYLDGNHAAETVSWMVVEGSIPDNGGYYCSGDNRDLRIGTNLFAIDNCDHPVAFGFTETPSVQPNGNMLTVRAWMTADNCGNTNLITRYDTCTVAALMTRVSINGSLIGSTNGMMRDDLRARKLVPVVEPFSSMPAFPHVDGPVIVPGAEPSANTIADLPAEAATATFRTIADGNWTTPATWKNGNVPPINNLVNTTISIEHNVTLQSGHLDLKSGSKLWVTNGGLNLLNGRIRLQGSSIIVENSAMDIKDNIETWTGNTLIWMKNCELRVQGNFTNESGTRRLENVCMVVEGDLVNGYSGVFDTLINVTAIIGGEFKNYNSGNVHAVQARFRLTGNKDFRNHSNSLFTGSDVVILVENGSIVNDATWQATVSQYCVSGSAPTSLGQYLPAAQNCAGIAESFGGKNCRDIVTIVQQSNEPSTGLTPEQIEGPGTIDPAMLEVTGNSAVVDWILVELRNPEQEKDIKAYATAILLRDGTVVNEDGDEIITFPDAPEGDYIVAVRHRNHLGLMTNEPFYLSTQNPPLIDFTDPNLPVRGGGSAGRVLNGKRSMWGGDLNGDGKVIYQGPYNDVFALFSRVLADSQNGAYLANFIVEGYEAADMNLDGRVIYQGPNNDRASLLYHTVLSHGSNNALLANFIVKEILP